MFGMCNALVGWAIIAEVHLGFLLIRHIHEDINQKFNVISKILKQQGIDSM